MKGTTLWTLIAIALGLLAAVLWGNALAARLGLPLWLVFIGVWLDVGMVLYIPALLRDYFATWQLIRRGPPWSNSTHLSSFELLVLTLLFAVAPLAVLIWVLLRWFEN